jgi:hypothetical protein
MVSGRSEIAPSLFSKNSWRTFCACSQPFPAIRAGSLKRLPPSLRVVRSVAEPAAHEDAAPPAIHPDSQRFAIFHDCGRSLKF